ncbi:ATP-binding protein [Luteitalea sp.]|uniref:sensor histidine kinase n=1 Tax=Luteitalea sp. TaxID=2004800 RepID=UPI0025C61A87|nr:ATP-binding protein [Luteitalea sp.]
MSQHSFTLAPAVRWMTCALLWTFSGGAWLLPHLGLSFSAVAPVGLAAAICHTVVALVLHTRGSTPALLLGLRLVTDVALLTALLDITGGPFNPFIVMYAVYVWLAAMSGAPGHAVAVAAVAAAGFGWLVVDHVNAELAGHHRLNDFPTHLFAMWFCGAGVVELVAIYVERARVTLAQRQQELDEARERAARSERLSSLTTLAAGAAHELSTPLATIAVAARELEHNAASVVGPEPLADALRDDARLIRNELDRCRAILDGMSGRATGMVTSTLEPMAPEAIAHLVTARLTERQRAHFVLDIADGAPTPSPTGAEVVQAISALVRNAFDATGAEGQVVLRFGGHGAIARIEVRDEGVGMSAEAQRRAGEPFYTTKAPGHGLGLGLFLARTFAERAGGSLEVTSGHGTTAALELPAAGQS